MTWGGEDGGDPGSLSERSRVNGRRDEAGSALDEENLKGDEDASVTSEGRVKEVGGRVSCKPFIDTSEAMRRGGSCLKGCSGMGGLEKKSWENGNAPTGSSFSGR